MTSGNTNDVVISLPSGRYSIRCGSCGKRHVQKFYDEDLWCRSCREECEAGGHEP